MAIAAALLLALVGCSNGDEEETPQPPTVWTKVDSSPFSYVGEEGKTEYYTIQKVAFGNNKFVATGNNGSAWYSNDGVTWTASSNKTALGTSNLSGLTFGDGKFLTTGGSSRNMNWAYSTDGDTWTATGSADSDTGTNFNAKGLAYGKGVYLIGGSSGRIAYASDLTASWTILAGTATTITGTGGASFINAIAFGNNMFVAGGGGGQAAYSTDGATWTAIPQLKDISSYINGIAYGDGKFVAVGEAVGETNPIAYASASDITNWTAVAKSPFSDPDDPDASPSAIYAIAYGNGYFVTVQSSSSKAAYSSDGIIWTAIADTTFDPTEGAINGIAYGNGKFVIVGVGGEAAYAEVK
jgi:hypothetical protein